MRVGHYVRWLSGLCLWAAVALSVHRADAKLVDRLLRRARKLRECSTDWAAPECQACGHVVSSRRHPRNPCDSRFCPLCAARHGKREERVIERFMRQHEPFGNVGWFRHTFTIPTPAWFSVARLGADFGRVASGVGAVWDQLFSPHVTRFARAAAIVAFEPGSEGMVHAHLLRYGPLVRSERIRAIYSAAVGEPCQTHDEVFWIADRRPAPDGEGAHEDRVQAGRAGRAAVKRAVRYLLKGATKAVPGGAPGTNPLDDERTYEFLDPTLVISFELAVGLGNRVRRYGELRGEKKRLRDERIAKKQARILSERDLDEHNRLARMGPTCECGGDTCWVHERRSKPGAPQEWADDVLAAPAPEDVLGGWGKPLVPRAPRARGGGC